MNAALLTLTVFYWCIFGREIVCYIRKTVG